MSDAQRRYFFCFEDGAPDHATGGETVPVRAIGDCERRYARVAEPSTPWIC